MIDGLIIDNFAGGGGASTGIEQALGRSIDIAINHDPEAVAMHKANHPDTLHYCQSVWKADPREVVTDPATGKVRPVALAWFSPDCKHFSKAKGGKPRSKHIRDLAWVVVLWAKRVRPAVIMLENVEEFRTWGPLDDDGNVIRERAGETFQQWTRELRKLGYRTEWKELRACDFGAPTSRKRFFMIARCDSQPIVWPAPTHGKPGSPEVESGQRRPWRTAAEIIDWSIPCPSIFERARPLKDATCRRIAGGIMRFVLNNPRPFIVPVTNSGWNPDRAWDSAEPLGTITTAKGGEMALVAPYFARTAHGEVDRNGKRRGKGHHGVEDSFPTVTQSQDSALIAASLIQTGYGEREGQAPRVLDVESPLGTVVAGGVKHAAVAAFLEKFSENSRGKPADAPLDTVMAGAPRHAVVYAHMAQHNGGRIGRETDAPLQTVTHRGTQTQLVTSHMVKLQNHQTGKTVDAPVDTILAGGQHYGEVRAFLTKYYGNEEGGHSVEAPLGTVTTKERFGLVTVSIDGEEYALADIGMRMLTPRELFAAQGFPADYDIEAGAANGGKPLTKTSQIAKCGNSVCPDLSRALVQANFAEAIKVMAAA
ncbi:MAG: DNA cytosine methyltransferase [Sphingobium sp.]|nr:DNA cytosine methyltransferase [Sphingobium sp.]